MQMAVTTAPAVAPADPTAQPVELARALGDPLRWRIIELLASEQLCVAHLSEELETAQPLVSHHLKVLKAAGLVETDRYRYWTYYRLRPAALVRLAATLGLVARSAPNGTACRRLVPGADPSQPAAARSAVPQGGRPMPFRDQPMDPTSRQTFARSIEALHEEFRGIYPLETIERYVNESIDRLSGARVVDFIPLFVHRFAREQLRALAQAEGAIIKDVPEILFVCVHNAGRSQMAAALLDHHAQGRVHVRSAGSAPGDQINPAVMAAMDEWGIDLSREFPKPLTDEFVKAADAVITMGCGDACPIYPGKRYEDWELDDPAGQPVEVVRAHPRRHRRPCPAAAGRAGPSRRLTTALTRGQRPGRLASRQLVPASTQVQIHLSPLPFHLIHLALTAVSAAGLKASNSAPRGGRQHCQMGTSQRRLTSAGVKLD